MATHSPPPQLASRRQHWTQVYRYEMSKRLHRMPTQEPRCDTTVPAGPSTATQPTSSPPSSLEPANDLKNPAAEVWARGRQ